MKADRLLKRLKNEGYLFQYIGSLDEEIYGVTPWVVDGEGKGLLQICYENYNPSSRAVSVLVLTHFYDAAVVLSLLQTWLVEDFKRQEYLNKLHHAVYQNHSLYEVTRLCSQAMNHPAILMDQELHLLVQFPVDTLADSSKAHITSQVQNWRYAWTKAAAHIPVDDCMIRMIIYDEKCYYLVILADIAHDKKLCYEEEILNQICQCFDANCHRSDADSMEKIITGLLLRRFALTDHDRARLKMLGWVSREKYYVILIEKPEPMPNDFVQEVQNIIGTGLYLIGHQYAAILWSDKYVELTEKHLQVLHNYLIRNKCMASLSFGFFDLADAPAYFEQCCRCTEMAKRQGYTTGVWGVSRFHLSTLMRLLPQENTVDLRQFCHPTVLLLYQIDRESDSAYLDTLFTYIVSGRSVKRTAAAMNLHVNTIYTRVTRLQDRFNIDFNDDHLLYTLHNSINLLNLFYDTNTLNTGFPFLE